MNRTQTVARLKSYADAIKALGATSLFLFGSTARNENNSNSDLDLFVDYDRVTGIINAQRSVTADTALRLGHWFGTSPDFWLNLQMLYELRLAQREIGKRVEKLPRRADRKRKDTHASGMM